MDRLWKRKLPPADEASEKVRTVGARIVRRAVPDCLNVARFRSGIANIHDIFGFIPTDDLQNSRCDLLLGGPGQVGDAPRSTLRVVLTQSHVTQVDQLL